MAGPIKRPIRLFSVRGIELFGPLRPPLPGDQQPDVDLYILTVCCKLTSYTRFEVIGDGSAEAVAKHPRWVLRRWGVEALVDVLWADIESQFTSAGLAAVAALFGLRQKCAPAFTPSLAGWYECNHRDAKRPARAMLAIMPRSEWREIASFAEDDVKFHRPNGD